jgi:hypothetical protein
MHDWVLVKVVLDRMQVAYYFQYLAPLVRGTAVAQWLRYCATNRKVTGSIPDGVI